MVGQGREWACSLNLLQSVLDVNRGQPDEVLGLIGRHFDSLRDVPSRCSASPSSRTPTTCASRPAFPIIRRLKERGARLTAYDPVARPSDNAELAGVTLATSMREAVADAEVVVVVTRWPEFSALADALRASGRSPLVVDGRRVLDPASFDRYEGIGR